MTSKHRNRAFEPAVLLARPALGLILALGLAACGTQSDAAGPEQPMALPPTATAPAFPATVSVLGTSGACDVAAWAIELEVSGGFEGIQRSLKLDSGGQAVAVDVRKGTESTSQLAKERLERLRVALRDLCPFKSAGRPAACADCFEYALTIHWGDQNIRFQATDVTLAEQGLEPLIGELSALLVEILGD